MSNKSYKNVDEMLQDICDEDDELLKEWLRPRRRFGRWLVHWKIFFAFKWSKLTGREFRP